MRIKSKYLIGIMILFALNTTAQSHLLSEKDRDNAVYYLEQTRYQLLVEVNNLTEEQWSFQQEEGRWSIAEIMEHVYKTDSILFTVVSAITKGKPNPDKASTYNSAGKLVLLEYVVAQKGRLFNSFPQGRPISKTIDKEKLKEKFTKQRDNLVQYITQAKSNLREYYAPFPSPIQELDGYEWIMFSAAHSERHLDQIGDVKNSLRFPR